MERVNVIKVSIADGIVESMDSFEESTEGNQKAEERFLEVCSESFYNWDEYTDHDKQVIIENGYEKSGIYTVQIFHS